MTNWKCNSCGTVMRLADNRVPERCCCCGSTSLTTPQHAARLATYAKYDAELDAITERLNALTGEAAPLHARYTEIMQYFRQQKRRKLITDEDYARRAKKYAALKKSK